MIKKAVVAVVMLFVATNTWADVAGTRHNLSSTSTVPFNQYMATNEDEVCVFCHTPHGGTLVAALWNRNLPVGAFTHYTSATLAPSVGAVGRPVQNESLVCLSCHDGSVAMNSIINSSGATPDNTMSMQTMWTGIGAVIGATNADLTATRDLSDDHPISFSYVDVLGDPGMGAKLHTVGDAETAGVRFFPLNVAAAAGTKRVECSSCHDPHINHESSTGGNPAYAPFLVMPNTASALCLACHIK